MVIVFTHILQGYFTGTRAIIPSASETTLQNTSTRQTSNIRRTLVDSKLADHSDGVRASPVGAAPTTSSLLT